MSNEKTRFSERFTHLFNEEGLINVKFFVRRDCPVKLSDFVEDANKMNDTIAAGDFHTVTSVDGDLATKRFDAAF